MQTLSDAILWLSYFPDHMDTRRSLWLVRDMLDVNAYPDNTAALAIGTELEDLAKCTEFFSLFPSLFLAIADRELSENLSEALRDILPTISILTPRKGAFGKSHNIRELLDVGGEKAVSRLMMGAEEQNAQGLLDLADVERVDPLKQPSVLSGIKQLDMSIGGFYPGELSIWTGKRGCGKSTLLGQTLIDAIDQGQRVCAYSGELAAWRFKQWTMLQAAGSAYVQREVDKWSGKDFWAVTEEASKRIDDWWRGYFFLYDNKVSSASDENSILSVFQYAVRRYGCSVFLVDNLMTARFSTSADRDFYRAQSNFTGRLVEFAKKFEVHVHLVAHPRKTDKIADADEVGGSGDITNRADNVFSLDRLKEEDASEKGFDTVLSVLKNRSFGNTAKIGLCFDESTRRFRRPDEQEKHYGWEFSGHREFTEEEDDGNMPF